MAKPSAPEAGVVLGSPPPGPGMPGVATAPPGQQPAMDRGRSRLGTSRGPRPSGRGRAGRAEAGLTRARPRAGAGLDYPPALEYLARLEQMKIKQKVNMCVAGARGRPPRRREGGLLAESASSEEAARLTDSGCAATSGETLTGGCWVQPTRMKYENWGNQQMYEYRRHPHTAPRGVED